MIAKPLLRKPRNTRWGAQAWNLHGRSPVEVPSRGTYVLHTCVKLYREDPAIEYREDPAIEYRGEV